MDNTGNRSSCTRRRFLSTTGRGALGLALGSGGLLLSPTSARAEHSPAGSRFRPAVSSTGGVVASISRQASQIGVAVLNAGGNAMDAAVAMVFAMGVARPDMGGIGGGGFLLCRTREGEAAALDFREKAPAAMHPRTFDGPGMHRDGSPSGHRVVGVPGVVAGMAAALDRFGSGQFTLAGLIAPAERLARDGVIISPEFSSFIGSHFVRFSYYEETLKTYAESAAAYFSDAPFRQPDYARSLRLIMEQGSDAFYGGEIAQRIVSGMQQAGDPNPTLAAAEARNRAENEADRARNQLDGGSRPADRWEVANDLGLMTLEDLAAYRVIWREPLEGSYRPHALLTMPPATAGGIAVLEMLNILERFDLRAFGQFSADHLHVLAEAQKLAWADRTAYVADPDYVNVPTSELTSKDYAKTRRDEIRMDLAGSHGPGAVPQDGNTNHLSAMDRDGNCVTVTTSLNSPFGSIVVPPGLGFPLNNQLADFTWDAPGNINQPEGGKRPRSSMSPIIVLRRDRPLLATGAAGSVRIPMGVVQAIVNMVDFELDLAHALDAARIHAESANPLPTLALEEARIQAAVRTELAARRHALRGEGEYASRPTLNAVSFNRATGRREAVTDPRRFRAFQAQFGREEEEFGAGGQ